VTGPRGGFASKPRLARRVALFSEKEPDAERRIIST
jgi:hypothetical protein